MKRLLVLILLRLSDALATMAERLLDAAAYLLATIDY